MKNNNSIVAVLNYSSEDFVEACYKVYFGDGDILVKNIIGRISYSSHDSFSVDKGQGLVILTYAHMGNYSVNAYDVKKDKIEIFDQYSCSTGNCNYVYKGIKVIIILIFH